MKKLILLLIALLALTLALAACCAAPEGSSEPAAEEAAEEAAAGEQVPEESAGLEEAQLDLWTFLCYDPAVAQVEDYTVSALDGSWTMDIHTCDSADEVEQYRGYYDKALTSDKNSDLVEEEKTLGDYTWSVERHVANGQNFGTFFTAIDPPVAMPDNYGDVYGVYCYLWMEDFASMDAMADIIGTLAFREAE